MSLTDAPSADRRYPSRPILAVSIAVFRGDRVLLATRTVPPFLDVYSLPGGGVELGEKLQEAALRELWEEVRVEARVVAFNRHAEIVDRDREGRIRHHYVVANFVGEWIAGDGTPGPEAGTIAWVELAGLRALKTMPDLVPVIERARQLYRDLA